MKCRAQKMNKFEDYRTWNPIFYHTYDFTKDAADWWKRSLRQLDQPINVPSDGQGSRWEASDGRCRARQRVSTAASSSGRGKAEAAASPSPTRDASTRHYWRRVRSLSRENRQRQEARERQMKKAELEERRRREQILSERKKERDTLMIRFLREPLRQRRAAKAPKASAERNGSAAAAATAAGEGEEERVRTSQSVPDLEEALRIVRGEDQALDARSRAFLSPHLRRRAPKDQQVVCDRFLRTHARPTPSRHSPGTPLRRGPAPPTRPFPPGSAGEVIRENQKPYPTWPPEELLSRNRQPRSKNGDSAFKMGTTQVLSDTFSISSDERDTHSLLADYRPPLDSHIMVLPRPKLDRRSSMPDLRDFRCVSSAVVYETIATLGSLGDARGLLVVPPGCHNDNSNPATTDAAPDLTQTKKIDEKSPNSPQRWAKKMNTFIEQETQAVLHASPLLGALPPSLGRPSSQTGRRTQRKEWVSKHTSMKTLQKKILPTTLTDSASQTDSTRPTSAVHRRRNSHGSEGAESVYYDSLEEDESRSATHRSSNQAFYVPMKSEAASNMDVPTLPARLTARLEERKAASRRRPIPNTPSNLTLTGKRVHVLLDEAKLAQLATKEGSLNNQETSSNAHTNNINGQSVTTSDSDILDSPEMVAVKRNILPVSYSEPDTETSQTDILQLSPRVTVPVNSQIPKRNTVIPRTSDTISIHIVQPEAEPEKIPQQYSDTYSSFSGSTSPSLSTGPSDEVTPSQTNPYAVATTYSLSGTGGTLVNDGEDMASEPVVGRLEPPNSQGSSGTQARAEGCDGDGFNFEETDKNSDILSNGDNIDTQPGQAPGVTNTETGEESSPVATDDSDLNEVEYDTDTFQSTSKTLGKSTSDHTEAIPTARSDNFDNNKSKSDTEVVVDSSGLDSNDILSASDGTGEVSESLITENNGTSDDELLQTPEEEVKEESSIGRTQEQYEIVGYTASGREMLLESGFIDCDDPSLSPDPISISCDHMKLSAVPVTDVTALVSDVTEKNTEVDRNATRTSSQWNQRVGQTTDSGDVSGQSSPRPDSDAEGPEEAVLHDAGNSINDDDASGVDRTGSTRDWEDSPSDPGSESNRNVEEYMKNIEDNSVDNDREEENKSELVDQSKDTEDEINSLSEQVKDNCLSEGGIVEREVSGQVHPDDTNSQIYDYIHRQNIAESEEATEETDITRLDDTRKENLSQNTESREGEELCPIIQATGEHGLCPGIEPVENDSEAEELSDGTDSWDRVTVVRAHSGSGPASRNLTPDIDTDTALKDVLHQEELAEDESGSPRPSRTSVASPSQDHHTDLLEEIFRAITPSEGKHSPVDETSSGLSTIDEDEEPLEAAAPALLRQEVTPLPMDEPVRGGGVASMVMVTSNTAHGEHCVVMDHGEHTEGGEDGEATEVVEDGEDIGVVEDGEDTVVEDGEDIEVVEDGEDTVVEDVEDTEVVEDGEDTVVEDGEDTEVVEDGKDIEVVEDGEDTVVEDGEDTEVVEDGKDIEVVEDGEDIEVIEDGEDTVVEDGEDIEVVEEGEDTVVEYGKDTTVEDGEDTEVVEDGEDTVVEYGEDTTVEDGEDTEVVEDGEDIEVVEDGEDTVVEDGEDIEVIEDGEDTVVEDGEDIEVVEDGEDTVVEDGEDTEVVEVSEDTEVTGQDPVVKGGEENMIVEDTEVIEDEDSVMAESEDSVVTDEDRVMVGEDSVVADEDRVMVGEDSVVADEDRVMVGGEDSVVADEDRVMVGGEDSVVADEDRVMVGGEDSVVADEDRVMVGGKDNVVADEDSVMVESEDSVVADEDSVMAESEDSVVAESEDSVVADEDSVMVGGEDSVVADEDSVMAESENSVVAARGSFGTVAAEECEDTGVVLTGEETGVVLTGEETGVVLTGEDTGVVLTGEDAGVVLTGEDTGVVLTGEDTGVVLTGEDTSVVLTDEDTGVVLTGEETVMVLTGEDTGLVLTGEDTGVVRGGGSDGDTAEDIMLVEGDEHTGGGEDIMLVEGDESEDNIVEVVEDVVIAERREDAIMVGITGYHIVEDCQDVVTGEGREGAVVVEESEDAGVVEEGEAAGVVEEGEDTDAVGGEETVELEGDENAAVTKHSEDPIAGGGSENIVMRDENTSPGENREAAVGGESSLLEMANIGGATERREEEVPAEAQEDVGRTPVAGIKKSRSKECRSGWYAESTEDMQEDFNVAGVTPARSGVKYGEAGGNVSKGTRAWASTATHDPDRDVEEAHRPARQDWQKDNEQEDISQGDSGSHILETEDTDTSLFSNATLDLTDPIENTDYEELLNHVEEYMERKVFVGNKAASRSFNSHFMTEDSLDIEHPKSVGEINSDQQKTEDESETSPRGSEGARSGRGDALRTSDGEPEGRSSVTVATGEDHTAYTAQGTLLSCGKVGMAPLDDKDLTEYSGYQKTQADTRSSSETARSKRSCAIEQPRRPDNEYQGSTIPERHGRGSGAPVSDLVHHSSSAEGHSGGNQPEASLAAASSASSDNSPRNRSGDDGDAATAAISPSSDSGVVEMVSKLAQSPSEVSAEGVEAVECVAAKPEPQESTLSEESAGSIPCRRPLSKQAKDRANRITSGHRSSSGCGRASQEASEATAVIGWRNLQEPADDSEVEDSDPRRQQRREAPRLGDIQGRLPQADGTSVSPSRRQLVQEYVDNLQRHRHSDGGSSQGTAGSPPGSLDDLLPDNQSDYEASDSGEASYSERLLKALEARRSRRHRPRSSNIDIEDTPNRYRPSTLSALDAFLATLSRYRGGHQLEGGEPGRDDTPPLLPPAADDNVTVQVRAGPRQHDVRISSKRQVRLVVNVGNPAASSDSGIAPDTSQSERTGRRTGGAGGSAGGRRRGKREARTAAAPPAPPPPAADADAANTEVDQLLTDVREYLNKKLKRDVSVETGVEPDSAEAIVVEGSNIEKCFRERPVGGGRTRLHPKGRVKQEERRSRAPSDPALRERQRIQNSITAINGLLKQFS